MLTKISSFLKSLAENDSEQTNELNLEIACCVMLCEVMRADGALDALERKKLSDIISQQFTLPTSQVEELINQALTLSENATDFYQFTNKINENYSLEQRIKMLSMLWEVAFADGQLASIEEHIIRKVADLLHLRHSEYIQTKLAVQTQTRKPTN